MNITLHRLRQAREESTTASQHLSHQEKEARDTAFKESWAYSELEGFLWNVCWDAARNYYVEHPSGEEKITTRSLKNV